MCMYIHTCIVLLCGNVEKVKKSHYFAFRIRPGNVHLLSNVVDDDWVPTAWHLLGDNRSREDLVKTLTR